MGETAWNSSTLIITPTATSVSAKTTLIACRVILIVLPDELISRQLFPNRVCPPNRSGGRSYSSGACGSHRRALVEWLRRELGQTDRTEAPQE
jgi:hypothetical protein